MDKGRIGGLMGTVLIIFILLAIVEGGVIFFLVSKGEPSEYTDKIESLENELLESKERIQESEEKVISSIQSVEKILKSDKGVKNEAIPSIVASLKHRLLK